MFTVGNILNRAHNYFQDFWKRFSIFNKATNLQKIEKEKQSKAEAYLAPTNRPTSRPSPAAAPASCLAWPGRQAAARRRAQHACHVAARRLAAPLVQLMTGIAPPLSPEPPRHLLFSLVPLPRAPQPWPPPPPPPHRRSRAPRRPCSVSPCLGAPPPSSSSS